MATIADKSRSKEIIERLQGILNSASPVPLASGKVSIYKDEVQSLLDELAMQMDAEIKTYHEVNDRRGRIITEAKKEAEQIILEAERSASRMRVTKRATNVSAVDPNTLSEEAIYSLTEANEIYAASLIYTDEMLTEVSKMIEDAYHNIRSDYEVVMSVMEEKLNTITSNKNELMSGLQELDGKDRSQQIMEIGHLLSEELYNERMKKRMNSDQYDDGSVQLSLDLQMEQAEETARQAQEFAREAVQALEQVTAERDALIKTVQEMENTKNDEKNNASKSAAVSDKEAAEVIQVVEDELGEDEEYEIEYIDEEEYDKLVAEGKIDLETGILKEDVEIKATDEKLAESKTDTADKKSAESKTDTADKKLTESKSDATDKKEALNNDSDKKETSKPVDEKKKDKTNDAKADSVKVKESVPGVVDVKIDTTSNQADAITEKLDTTGVKNAEEMAKQAREKKKGLIGRAVAQREMEEAGIVVEKDDPILNEKKEPAKEEIKTDSHGNQYVQATMQFDENFEITEF